jgi:cytochrome c peroxidase
MERKAINRRKQINIIWKGGMALISLSLLLFACSKKAAVVLIEANPKAIIEITIPHFPSMPIDSGKFITKERAQLGKDLFFDPILSRNFDISCSSCHHTNLAFSDGLPVSIGTEGRMHNRNSPTLFNIGWHPYFFMDGGNPSLESQVIGPIEEHREMDLAFTEAIARVAAAPDYPAKFQQAFDLPVSAYTLSLALATYERTLISSRSAFDEFYYFGDTSALDGQEQRGLELFQSAELNCIACHSFPLTSDFSFQNNGLYDDYTTDPGRARVTNNIAEHEGQFKVATLRNIALTNPYMHDGSLAALEDVIDHYASGGSQHRLKSNLIKGFTITAADKAALLSFLESLTDTVSYKEVF